MADNLPKTRLLHELLAEEVNTLDLAKANVIHADQHHWDGADPLTAVDVAAEPSLGTVGSAGTYGVEETVLGVHGLKALVEADISDLQDYALDNAVVHLTGNESVGGVKTFTDGIIVGSYERHIQIPAEANGTVANQPAQVDFFTAGGLQFSASLAKYAFCQWEIPDDWDGTDIYFEIDWMPDSGAMSGTDAIRWTVEYRSIAEGEAINNGTSVTLDNGVGGDTTDYAQYQTKHSRVTLAFDNANQPLTKQDHIYFKISRDTSVANDFAGTVTVLAYEIIYNSVGIPTSN